MDRETYRAETLRLAAALRDEIRTLGVSIRSLEQKMGVGNSIFQKVLNGKITMTVFHLLQILDGLGLDHAEFFRKVYPIVSPPDLAEGEEDEFDRRVLNLLRRHGLIDGGDPG
jgi:transcriptional regulator with XRE-family HTH domain